ncbi:hypothetical protein [Actinophytocola sp.]|uniref:hypothetical protein n=1 Tax=Actinophytocola sp. TaxID=1872138 RepID=UPI002ECFF2B1
MAGIRLAAVACGLGVVLAGCGTDSGSGPGFSPEPGDEISLSLLGLDADGFAAGGPYAALSPVPIHLGAFASWYGRSEELFDEPSEASSLPADPTYLAATASTGCREPTDVVVSRRGADLTVEFVGGEDHQTCLRAVEPAAYLAVPSDMAAGVKTVNGVAPVAPEGPGELLDFVELGSARLDPPAPVELGTPAATAMRDMLANAGAPSEAATALARQPEPAHRSFGFVLTGCAETSAVLLLDQDRITAALVGAENTNCDAPAYFLTTFTVDAERVPESAVLAG